MSWLGFSIRRGVEKSVDDFLSSDRFKEIVRNSVRKALRDAPHWPFLKQIQWKLQDADKSMTDEQGFKLAKQVLVQHLKDEDIEFGDPRFGWTEECAHELAEAYEIEYWDQPK